MLSGKKPSYGTTYITQPLYPNPEKFEIKSTDMVNGFLIAEVQYPNCTNFEGKKILVFKGMTIRELATLDELDPHFYEDSKLIARFVPTSEGMSMARSLAYSLP